MKKLARTTALAFGLAAAFLSATLLGAPAAHAQAGTSIVVSACNGETLPAGSFQYPRMAANDNHCEGGGATDPFKVVTTCGLESLTVGSFQYPRMDTTDKGCGASGGGGTPGGSNTQLQYNNSTAFGGITGATSNGTTVTFANSDLLMTGSSTGVTTFTSANAGASNFTITVPAATDTLVDLAGTQTLTNKTLTSPTLTTPALGVATGTSLAVTGALSGLIAVPINAQSSTTYTVLSSDQGKLVTTSNAGSIAITLPQAGTTGFLTGWSTTLENIGAGTATITPTTSTIDGAATAVLSTNSGAAIFSDGTNYFTFRGFQAASGAGGCSTPCSSAQTISANGAASAPSILFSGTAYTGGTGTTNFPQLLFQPGGTTAETNWNTAGTIIGMNLASGFTGLPIDIHIANGAALMSLNQYGGLTVNGLASGTLAATSTVTLSGVTTGSNADFLCLTSGGVVTLQTSACTISSLRFKKDVQFYKGDALAEIDRLTPITFRFKDGASNIDPNARSLQLGLPAENIAAVDPRMAVYENDMKTPKSYRQESVIALLVKGIQEQQREIEVLRRQVANDNAALYEARYIPQVH